MGTKVECIAEVGSNHGLDLDCAKKYIKSSKAHGADAVKFQSIKKDRLLSPKILDNGVVIDNPVWPLVNNLDFPDEWFAELQNAATAEGIEFFSTPFYLEAVDMLEKVGVSRYKIASGDITFIPLLEKVGQTEKPVVLATGASSLSDVETAISVLQNAGAKELTILHCVSNYPPEWEEMNLKAIMTLQSAFGLPVGISDHTPGSMVPIAAVAMGAVMIEKHVTFDRRLPGPDHPYAMLFEEFEDMVKQIRQLETALGNGIKEPSEPEKQKQFRMRRGTYDPVTFEPNHQADALWLRPYH